MSRVGDFRRTLDNLFRDRTFWLQNVMGRGRPGAPPGFGRKKVQRAISKLQTIASEALASKLAKAEFEKCIAKKKSWHVKGFGSEGKKRKFNAWFEKRVPYRSVVYAFWKGRRCVYIGKTSHGRGRPSNHFEKNWFGGVTRIDIYAVKGKRSLPSIECLAIH